MQEDTIQIQPPLVWPVTRTLPSTVVGYMAMSSWGEVQAANSVLPVLGAPRPSPEPAPEDAQRGKRSRSVEGVEVEKSGEVVPETDEEVVADTDEEDGADTEDDDEGAASRLMDNFFQEATEEDYRNMTIGQFYALADTNKQKWIGQLPMYMYDAMRDSYFKNHDATRDSDFKYYSPYFHAPKYHGTLNYEHEVRERTPVIVMRQGDAGVIRRNVTMDEQDVIFRQNKPSDKMFHFF